MPSTPPPLLRCAALLPLVAALAGCGATATTESPAVRPESARPLSPLAAMVSAENGLELRRWVVRDEAGRVESALESYGEPLGEPALEAALARDGFRLALVPQSELEGFLAATGEPLSDLLTWHGQAPEWRELLRRVARDPVAAVVGGRTRVFADGSLALLARAWTVPMEDGALLQLEIAARFEPVDRTGLRRLVGRDEQGGETLGSGPLEIEAGPGEAWILTAAPTNAASASAGVGPPLDEDLIGPSTLMPQTIGELLLSTERPRTRTLLVFLPRLPPIAPGIEPPIVAPAPFAEDLPPTAAPDTDEATAPVPDDPPGDAP